VLPVAATLAQVPGIARGGYVLAEAADGAPRAVLIGTGSELQLALKAQALLAAQGVPVRVVSMPCTNVFDRQDAAYQNTVLPRGLPAVAVEAAQPDFWRKYVGREGGVVGMTGYGESAPAPALYAHFGITAERVAQAVQRCLAD
jgi:transketolase